MNSMEELKIREIYKLNKTPLKFTTSLPPLPKNNERIIPKRNKRENTENIKNLPKLNFTHNQYHRNIENMDHPVNLPKKRCREELEFENNKSEYENKYKRFKESIIESKDYERLIKELREDVGGECIKGEEIMQGEKGWERANMLIDTVKVLDEYGVNIRSTAS